MCKLKLLVKDKGFYKSFFSMTLVIALQNLITFAVNLADNVMIGGYSQTAMSGVAIVNLIQLLLQMLHKMHFVHFPYEMSYQETHLLPVLLWNKLRPYQPVGLQQN